MDFGNNFWSECYRDGEECKEVGIKSTTFDGKRLTCKCFSGQRHDLESGDAIRFRSCPDAVHTITVMNPFEFAINCEVPLPSIPPEDTAVQVKIPQTFHHKRYSEAKCETLEFAERDDSKVSRFLSFTPHSSSLTSSSPAPLGMNLTVPNSRKCLLFVGEELCAAQKAVVDAYAHTCACKLQQLSRFLYGSRCRAGRSLRQFLQ